MRIGWIALALGAVVVGAGAASSAEDAKVAPSRARIEQAIVASGFAGVYAVSREGTRVIGGSVGTTEPGGKTPFTYSLIFPWASVTKQVVATLVMREVDRGNLALDAPASRYLPALARKGVRSPTVRELLQHRAGLPNPNDSAKDANGDPGFYTSGPTGLGWCLRRRGAPGGQWRYNNCDYVVLGAMLERIERKPLAKIYVDGVVAETGIGAAFTAAGPDARADANWPGGPTETERAMLLRYGAAGGMVGTADDMLAFDRSLMTGPLLSDRSRAEMWRGNPKLGYQALGQWSFSAPLKGCAGQVRIVERRGEIGRFQARNLILPDLGIAIVMLTNRGDFDWGEIWQGKGAAYDILSAAACA